jgi:hypothetical protein
LDFGLRTSFGVDGEDDTLAPEPLGRLANTLRVLNRRGVERNLIRPSEKDGPDIFQTSDSPSHGERGEGPFRRPFDDLDQNLAAFSRGRDVEEDQFIRSLPIVPLRHFRWIPRVAQVHEPSPLNNPAIFHIKAGDNPSC